ncbi:nucleoid-associated protein [Curvibacter lanceolatus]|uniref:nucleoid-associated protein n=1 Tax=Curvibacter lanceolatus TaxID=86182 RepID=UPI0009FEE1DD|nr:nucleoid-associated protein [Curvibacter lanceolatus]
MTQKLLNAVVHKLEKAAGAPARIVEARASLDIQDEPLQTLVNQVHAVYGSREAKSYGKFDPELSPVSAELHLKSLRDNENADFLEISKQLMRVLKDKSDGENFATGGHVLIADSSAANVRWAVVVILNNKAGTTINEDLKVIQSPYLDVDGIRFAGRVNLTTWGEGNTERYISFLKGKKNEVSQYFQKFLGCSTVQEDLNDTRNLVKAVKEFSAKQGLPKAEHENLLREVYKFAEDKATAKQPLDLSELANRVWPREPAELKNSFAQADPPIADGFIPRKRGLDGLTRFSAKASNWKLEFDREAIQDHTIRFNPDDETLIIQNLPPEVLANLRAEFSVNEEEENIAD